MIRLLFFVNVLMVCVSCATMSDEQQAPEGPINNEPGANDVILCEEPRPQVCTREYRPVCASMDDGASRTFATGCTSCADESVVSYKAGAC